MQKKTMLALAMLAALPAVAQEKPNDWENPAVNSINRLPPRTYAMPLADEQAALTDDLEPATPFKKSLNGDWKILWVGDPARRPTDFFRTDFDDSDWNVIDVPSCVEMRGYGVPGYTNVRYPHKNFSNPKDKNFAKIVDRDTGRADYNPVSSYRTTFTVPESWAGRDVILRFDGVNSAYYVWVNGRLVGYAEDSKLPSEFDITRFLNPITPTPNTQTPPNLLCVQVFRWCDGSYLEDQDMFRFSGIFRDVTLWAKPRDGIWDFKVGATCKAAGGTCQEASISVEGIDGEWRATLYDADKKSVASLSSKAPAFSFQPSALPRLWSAEDPYLYTLVVRKGADVRMKRVGFKEQKIVGNTVLVNGQPVKFKGVNRHETNPDNGRTVSLKDMMDDVLLMKKYNFNTVRTCHYPDHHLWYDLCDRYGLYVIAEANVEGHEPGYGDKSLGLFPEWDLTIVERNTRQAVFYRNNPAIVFWSMGNETGHGDCFRHAMAEVRRIDPTRLIHWERGNADADVDSTMYPSVEWLEKRGRLGNARPGVSLQGEGGGEGFAISGHTAGKPHIMCEYAHAMGNAIGNFEEYWRTIYAYPALSGGCIWDWADQAVWKYTGRMDLKTGRQERFLAYGGDFDESPNDGPFCVNGVVDPLRRVNPKLVEVGHVQRNLVVTKTDAGFELWNRFCFTYADEYAGSWELLEDGVKVAAGEIDVPHLAPLSRAPLALKGLDDVLPTLDPAKEHFVNVSFAEKADTPWAAKGWTVARDQLALTLPKPADAPAASGAAKDAPRAPRMGVEETADRVTVERARTTAVFDRATGTLSALVIRGVSVLDEPIPGVAVGPQLTCMRAMTDNDRWMFQGDTWSENRAKGYLHSGLTQLRYHPGRIRVGTNEVTVTVDVAGAKGSGFTHACTYLFNADGSVTLRNRVTPYGTMPVALPRLGLTLHLPPRLEQVKYYGRGPWENYVDRCTASFVGLYSTTVTDMFQWYVRPQDNGCRTGVRWVEFADRYGRGVRFSASEPLVVQALHYGWEDLEFARHVNGQRRFRAPPVPREEIVLNLDVRQTGLGGASCGPWPMDKYRFNPSAPVEWSVTIASAQR